jgi:DNA mismatch endonuclease (patch repair protein)
MVDIFSPSQRSRLMARINSKDTKPEWVLRSALHRLGFRYRLGGAGLPGRPDLVLPRYRTAIFVHGCFWHRHPGCRRATMPRRNAAFWAAKLEANVRRDADNVRALEQAGWQVLTLWECALYRDPVAVAETVAAALTAVIPRPGAEGPGQYPSLDRNALLAVAEEKVRYRVRKRAPVMDAAEAPTIQTEDAEGSKD